MLQQLTSILLAFYPLLLYANLTEQTTFSKHITNDWKPNMRKEKYSETLSQCSIFCISDQDLCDIFAMDEISKKCYYGKMLETLDPLSISTIDATLFEVYSKIPDFEQSSIFIKQGQLVHVFKKWGPEYKIEFDITVKKVPSNWTNIVQFTIGGKQGQYGDRIPGVYLVPSNRRVLVCSGVNGLINHQFSFEYSLNQLVHIVVKQFKDADTKYKYEIEVDGSIVHSVENTLVQQFTDVKFYACAPFDDACFTNDIGLFENFQFFH